MSFTFIPIGVQCTNAIFKKSFEKTHTLPFDWMIATPSFVFEMLELLLEKNINIEDLVKNHFFYCEKKSNLNGVEHYYTCENGFALFNSKYNVIFPHDENNIDSIHKYIRRFERLKDMILNSTQCLYFIYTSQSSLESGNFTIDGNIVINDVYVYLSKIYKLISKFRNNFKIILFDAIQEEEISLLDENITLIKLNKCNSCSELVPQMIEQDFFTKSSLV
jgi:hypothetical protein